MRWNWLALFLSFALLSPTVVLAESQGDYKGVTDPFGDPSNYEFAEDEKEDKEFFHLGRYLMFGIDVGVGIFTGGLGGTVEPGPYAGLRLVYFFDKSIAVEAAAHYGKHLDIVESSTASLEIDTNMIPLTLGFRYYFDTKNAPKAIAVANPYLAFGGGAYIRQQKPLKTAGAVTVKDEGDRASFGAFAGGGVEFPIYRRHIYLGLDTRYHMVFFDDEQDNLEGLVEVGGRAGDYFTTNISLTYNF